MTQKHIEDKLVITAPWKQDNYNFKNQEKPPISKTNEKGEIFQVTESFITKLLEVEGYVIDNQYLTDSLRLPKLHFEIYHKSYVQVWTL